MKRTALLAAILTSSCPTPAPAETWMTATIASYHSACPDCYNQNNYGLGVESLLSKNTRIITGWYDNSENRTSIYAGVAYTPLRLGLVRFGAALGGVTGYERRLSPMIVPTAQIEDSRVGMNFYAAHTRSTGTVGGLQLKFKF